MKLFSNSLVAIACVLSLGLSLSSLAADDKKSEVEPMGAFEKLNFARKMIGPTMDLKAASETTEKAKKQLEEEFVAEKIDDAKINKAKDDAKKGVEDLANGLPKLFAVLSEFITPERLAQMKAKEKNQGKDAIVIEEEKKEPLQIPASFSEEKIKKIRAMKARDLPREEALEDSMKMNDPDFMNNLIASNDAEKQKLVVAVRESGLKGIDLHVDQLREMRGYLSPEEMKTFFKLQHQVEEKKKKDREARLEAKKKAKEEAKEAEAKKAS